MTKVLLMTDSNCDLSESYLNENNVCVIPFHFNLNNIDYEDNFGKSISNEDFYNSLRQGNMSTTSQITPYTYGEYFMNYVKKGYSIIYIAFSSGLSESYNHALLARESVMHENPEADITIIDSKAASVGEGLLVQKAIDLLKSGKSKDQIITWLETNKMFVNQWFTVDSLEHLKRGGRISPTSAYLGIMLQVKPILTVDAEGKLTPVEKLRGRKKAIKHLHELLVSKSTDLTNETVYISHGDCLEEAEELKEMIIKDIRVKEVVIRPLGPIIGTHTGPGLLCVVFMGEKRTLKHHD
jgi:DegV family protein with EDD domain